MTGENQDLEHLIQGFHLSCQTEGKSPKTPNLVRDIISSQGC